MPLPSPSSRDRAEFRLVLTWVLAPLACAFVTAIVFVRFNHKPVWKLVGDPSATLGTHPLLGFFSNVGIVGWCAGSAVALFAAWLLHGRRAPREVVRFHALLGAFTGLIMVDDFFMIHDALAPEYLHIPEDVTYSFYGVIFVAMFATCRRVWLARNPALFATAFAMLAFTAGVDAMPFDHSHLISLAMTASKFLGIFAWTAWLVVSARNDLTVPAPDEVPLAREFVAR